MCVRLVSVWGSMLASESLCVYSCTGCECLCVSIFVFRCGNECVRVC
jgi:hypothetical protein